MTLLDKKTRKLAFLVTELGYFSSHRLPLALAAQKAGFTVTVVTNCHERPNLPQFESQLKSLSFYHLSFHRSRLNPLAEIKTLWRIWTAYRHIRPDIVHQVALKPVIYGTFCARIARVPQIVNALGGMGYLFTHQSIKSKILKSLIGLAFRLLLKHPRCTLILQNPDDIGLMAPFVGHDRIQLIRGVGVDLKKFYPKGETPTPPVKAVMASRLLWSKGVGEVVEAARLLEKEGVPLEIQIAGEPDSQNPTAISCKVLSTWKSEKKVTWLGKRTDIATLYNEAHIAILPSYYREGLPKALLEAAACGKPIITTDVPGCREVVVSGENGFLIPPRDAPALAKALKTLAQSEELRVQMGRLSRQKAELEFDEKKSIEQTLLTYHQKT